MFAAKCSAAALVSLLVLAPAMAFADFRDSSAQARNQVATLSQQQLDGLNGRVFSDAFIAAKIIGYDPAEIDQLRADVQTLKQENAQLRAQLSGLQGTLGTVVSMLTLILAKLT